MTERTGPAVFNPDGSHTHAVPATIPASPVPPVPPAPPYTFSDEFNGPAGTAPASAETPSPIDA